MSLAIVYSRSQHSLEAPVVRVEVNLANGLPGISIVGLPEAAVKESKDRVRAAIQNSQFDFPAKRITINLSPADLPKEGSLFDLPIAIGILVASHQLPDTRIEQTELIGELSLAGELRAVKGVLPIAIATNRHDRALIVPADNADEASLVEGLSVHPANTLLDVCEHLAGRTLPQANFRSTLVDAEYSGDLSDVQGQELAKRALVIAAAGNHHMLMVGPPGTGKTMLANRLPSILPPMTDDEALSTAMIQSISYQGFDASQWRIRPMRSPHHTSSGVALVGGGSTPKPGEISLAQNGILFLDELTEFDRRVLEVLREPLETGEIHISRAARQATFPAQFQLIAAMNPCPQGYDCDLRSNCQCSLEQQRKHRNRLSAPFLDRIDIQIDVPKVPHTTLREQSRGDSSDIIREKVTASRHRQLQRSGKPNSQLNSREIDTICKLDTASQQLLDISIQKLRLSTRAYHRILKVSRTIADLNQEENIKPQHLSEALQYRVMDRWQSQT